jgi:hypothetical protein
LRVAARLLALLRPIDGVDGVVAKRAATTLQCQSTPQFRRTGGRLDTARRDARDR